MTKPTVLITAAGENTRFFPFNTDTHKGAVTLLGQKLIARTLHNLAEHGFTKAIIVVSEKDFNGHGLSGAVNQADFPSLEIEFVHQPEAKGMGNALLLCEAKLGENFAAVFPYLANAGELLAKMLEFNSSEVVCSIQTDKPMPYGVLWLENGKATGLIEKPTAEQALAKDRIKGVYLLSQRLLAILKTVPESHNNFEEALHLLMQQESLPVLQLSSDLPSLKYPWHLFEHQALLFKSLKSYRAPSASIAETAVIDETQGPVHIGENAVIGHAAKIVGPSYIGQAALVGDFSFIRQSSLEADVHVGANTEVVRSIMMSGASLHSSYLADSILGEGVKVGAGLITSNKRLDRESVRTLVKTKMMDTHLAALGVMIGNRANLGIRVSTMPGVLIGSQAMIFPGQILQKNVEHYQEIKENFN